MFDIVIFAPLLLLIALRTPLASIDKLAPILTPPKVVDEAIGKVCAKMNGERLVYTVNGEYQIEDNGEIKDGSEVFIIKSVPSRYPFGKITKFVFKTNYKIKK